MRWLRPVVRGVASSCGAVRFPFQIVGSIRESIELVEHFPYRSYRSKAALFTMLDVLTFEGVYELPSP